MRDNIITVKDFNLWYGSNQALFDVNMDIERNKITAIIGPSGCGKSTLLRSMNRINDMVSSCKVQGEIVFHGKNIFQCRNTIELRKRIGMVFQKPCPFPMSIRANITYGPKMYGVTKQEDLDRIVESSLKQSALWDEIEDILDKSALSLSGGQQQRLCIARALSISPEVVLMDEPTSALDPIASRKIEELMNDLKKRYTIVIVTHNMQQAKRISDYTAFMYMGKLIEFNETEAMFKKPEKDLTAEYLAGKFG